MEDISSKLMILGSDRKKWQNSAVWQKKVVSKKNQGLRDGEVGGSRHSFARQ